MSSLLFVLSVSLVNAAVSVKGYYKSNGTYVQPHYRSNPDSNPYNNYSYPGNINPYTGKTATGNSDTYLKNYYDRKSSSSSSFNYSSPIINNASDSLGKDLSTLNNQLVRGANGTKIYKIIDGKKYWIPTAERFKLFGYQWSDVKIVDNDYLNSKDDGTITYKEGTLLKSSNLPFIWFVDKNYARKWIVAASDFEKCGFKWNNVYTVSESEIQSLDWKGDTTEGKIANSLCK